MAGFAGKLLMHARGQGLFDFDVAILAGGFALDVPHAARPGLVTVYTLDLFGNVHVLRQSRGLGEICSEIAVSSSPLHGSRVAYERAPSSAAAVCRGRRAAEGVHSFLTRGCIVAVKTACMADVASLLFRNRLLMRKR